MGDRSCLRCLFSEHLPSQHSRDAQHSPHLPTNCDLGVHAAHICGPWPDLLLPHLHAGYQVILRFQCVYTRNVASRDYASRAPNNPGHGDPLSCIMSLCGMWVVRLSRRIAVLFPPFLRCVRNDESRKAKKTKRGGPSPVLKSKSLFFLFSHSSHFSLFSKGCR